MLNIVRFEEYIRVCPYNRHQAPNSSRVSEKTKLIHYTDLHFKQPLLQAFLDDDEYVFIHIRKPHSMESIWNPWRSGFVYWKEIKITSQKCTKCLQIKPIAYFHSKPDRRRDSLECIICRDKRLQAKRTLLK